MKLEQLTIEAAHQGLQKREFSSHDLTEACLASIKQHDTDIEAYMDVYGDEALRQADVADEKIKKGETNPLAGIPLAIKDIILIKDKVATAGSKILENYVAPYNATVIDRLASTHAVFLGKTSLDEFAMGSSNENTSFKKTKNPWDTTRVPGGSSGGSTAAVAADMCIAALGTDTGGSVRQPASFCGVVGLKPTYGRVSRHGVMSMTSSLDQVGPVTKSVVDSAYLLQAIDGQDSNDATTAQSQPISLDEINKDVSQLTIGVPKEYMVDGMDEQVKNAVQDGIAQLQKMGAHIVEVSLPLTQYALAVYQLTLTSEVSSNLARYDGIRYGYSAVQDSDQSVASLEEVYRKSRAQGFGSEVKRRVILGTFALSAGYHDQYYIQAQKVRAMIQKEFEDVLSTVDCLVTPTSPTVAFKQGEKYEDPLTMYLSDIFTVPANIGGVCAISVPCGMVNSLPVGLQVVAKSFDETTMLRVAYQYEQATDWHTKRALSD